MTIRAELLVLVDTPAACAAVTWPNVERFDEQRVGSMEIPGSGKWFSVDDWSGKCGVLGPDLVRIFEKLFGNALITADGGVATEVSVYAKSIILKRSKAGKSTVRTGKRLDS